MTCKGKMECVHLPLVGTQGFIFPQTPTTPQSVNFRRGSVWCFSFVPAGDADIQPNQSCVGLYMSTLEASEADFDAPGNTTVIVSIGCGVSCFKMSNDIQSIAINQYDNGFVVYWQCDNTGQSPC